MCKRIKEITEQTGLSSHTIRYYEKEGLLPPIARDKNGIRCFTDDNLFWLDLVICLKKTKMPTEQIKKIVELSIEGDHTIPERKEILQAHRNKIDSQIQELENSKLKVDKKINFYNGSGEC